MVQHAVKLRLLSATGTISWIANYLWLPSEYTIAIILDIDRHHAATAIIFHTDSC